MIKNLLFLAIIIFATACEKTPCNLDLPINQPLFLTFENSTNNTPLIINSSNFVHEDSIQCIGLHKGYEMTQLSSVTSNNELSIHLNDLLSSGDPLNIANIIDTFYINYGQNYLSDTLVLEYEMGSSECYGTHISNYKLWQNGTKRCDNCLDTSIVLLK